MHGADTVLVIACGNPSHGDDGVAWHVLDGLRTLRPRAGASALHLRHAQELTPDLADCVSRAAGVVFVEARREGPPGQVRSDPIQPSPGPDPLARVLRPEGLLLYTQAQYGRAPRAAIISIAGERFEADGLSPAVARAVRWGVRAVLRQARTWSEASALAPNGV